MALVGSSGSGKSTCMSLLLRFYEPSKGSVLVDGRDVKEINLKWLRSQVGAESFALKTSLLPMLSSEILHNVNHPTVFIQNNNIFGSRQGGHYCYCYFICYFPGTVPRWVAAATCSALGREKNADSEGIFTCWIFVSFSF